MNSVIEIDGLKKTYPRTWKSAPYEALKGITMQVEEGEVFGFVGPNGAGKSTTIKILTGVMSASAGTAKLFGIDVSEPEARRGLGYVPENPSLPDYLTPYEILSMGIQLHGIKLANPREHCMQWLERFDLGKVANKLIRGFSKGMAQRTALAHALAVQPKLLILDEPLSGLDPIGRRDVVDIFAEFNRNGGSIFLTSHVLHDVERLAHRYGLINQGELATVSTAAALASEQELLLVRSQGTVEVAGMMQEQAGRWVTELPRADLWHLLQTLEKSGHKIVEIKPTLSLEAAFMHAVGDKG